MGDRAQRHGGRVGCSGVTGDEPLSLGISGAKYLTDRRLIVDLTISTSTDTPAVGIAGPRRFSNRGLILSRCSAFLPFGAELPLGPRGSRSIWRSGSCFVCQKPDPGRVLIRVAYLKDNNFLGQMVTIGACVLCVQ